MHSAEEREVSGVGRHNSQADDSLSLSLQLMTGRALLSGWSFNALTRTSPWNNFKPHKLVRFA